MNPVNLLSDLEDFVHDHRPHGPLTADATPPAWNGYLLTVACPCGVVLERWVTPMDAELDLLPAASLNRLRHRAAHQLGAQSLCGQLTKWTAISQGARFVLSLEIDFVGA